MFHSLPSHIKKRPFPAAVVILQCLFLLGLLILSLRPGLTRTLTAEDLKPTGAMPVAFSDKGGMEVSSLEEVEECTVLLCSIPLPSGAYDVEIQYQSVTQPMDPSYNMYGCGGWADFVLDSNPEALRANFLHLYDGNSTVTGRIWLRMGAGAEDLEIQFNYYGRGTLAIDQIVIREYLPYRAARILGFLALFAGVDLAWVFFCRGRRTGLGERRQYLILGLLAVTFCSSLLFFAGYLFDDGDLGFHLNRIVSLAQAIQDGQIPQRIQTHMLNGYGYATPLFYGDLFLLPPALLLLLGLPLQTAYQIFVVAVNLATALVAYWCLKKVVGDPWKALTGTALYVLSSYRLLNLVYRSAVGEYTAMIFLPLILYGFYRIYTFPDGEKPGLRDLLPLVLGMSGIIECHVLSCEMTALFALVLVAVLWKKTFQPRRFLALVKAAGLTILLNAWYLVPFLDSFLSMKLVVNTSGAADTIVTANLYQIFSLLPSLTDPAGFQAGDQGIATCLGPALVAALGAYLFSVLHRSYHPGAGTFWRRMDLLFLLGLGGAFMASSLIPWGNLHQISPVLYSLAAMVQFSWRYLGIATLCLVFGAVLLLDYLEKQFSQKWSRILAGIMVGATLLAAASQYTAVTREMTPWEIYKTSVFDGMEIMLREYLPEGTDLLELEENRVLTGEGVSAGELTREGTRTHVWCENSSGEDSYLDLPILAYDNYQATAQDGGSLAITTGENNRIRVTVPAGYEGVIQVEYREPLLWRASEGVSLVTLPLLVWLGCRPSRRKGGAPAAAEG